MAKRKGSSTPSGPRTRSRVAKEGREAREVESIQWLDKLPRELWEKVFDNVDENDLFPLALSCSFFRQKQKELVARARQSGPGSGKPRLALKTTFRLQSQAIQINLKRQHQKVQPASADYLRFCYNEKVSGKVLVSPYMNNPFMKKVWKDVGREKARRIRGLAAYYGHLPLLQELLKSSEILERKELSEIAHRAGESSSSQSLLLCYDF